MSLHDELELALADIDADLDLLLARAVVRGRRMQRRRRLAWGGALAAATAAGVVAVTVLLPSSPPDNDPAASPSSASPSSTTRVERVLAPGEPDLPTRAILTRLQQAGPNEDFAAPAAGLGAEIRQRAKSKAPTLVLVGRVISVRAEGRGGRQWVIAVRTAQAVTTSVPAPRREEMVEIRTRAPERPGVDPATAADLLQDIFVLAGNGPNHRWYADYGGLLLGTVRDGRLWLEPDSGWWWPSGPQIGPAYLGDLTTPDALIATAERAARAARG